MNNPSDRASHAPQYAFNHVGQCVRDIDLATRFYCELFGFTVLREIRPPDAATGELLRLTPPLGMTARYLQRDGFVLELLAFSQQPLRPASDRVMNEPGLTHCSFSVDDVDATLARVAELGGEVLSETNIGHGVFVRDPDGQLVEILPMSYRTRLAESG